MQGDAAIVWDNALSRGDLKLLDLGELQGAPPIETAILVSVFTEARAKDDDRLPPGETDRRGWWGNGLGEPIGSRVWLLRRSKRLPETLRLARDYIREALAWLIEDGLAARIDVDCAWLGQSNLAATITAHRADGTKVSVSAGWAWGSL